jgi:hypothetical protein
MPPAASRLRHTPGGWAQPPPGNHQPPKDGGTPQGLAGRIPLQELHEVRRIGAGQLPLQGFVAGVPGDLEQAVEPAPGRVAGLVEPGPGPAGMQKAGPVEARGQVVVPGQQGPDDAGQVAGRLSPPACRGAPESRTRQPRAARRSAMAQPARPAPRTTASRAGDQGEASPSETWGAARRPTSISRLLAKPGRFSVAKPASFSAPRTAPATHQVARVASGCRQLGAAPEQGRGPHVRVLPGVEAVQVEGIHAWPAACAGSSPASPSIRVRTTRPAANSRRWKPGVRTGQAFLRASARKLEFRPGGDADGPGPGRVKGCFSTGQVMEPSRGASGSARQAAQVARKLRPVPNPFSRIVKRFPSTTSVRGRPLPPRKTWFGPGPGPPSAEW